MNCLSSLSKCISYLCMVWQKTSCHPNFPNCSLLGQNFYQILKTPNLWPWSRFHWALQLHNLIWLSTFLSKCFICNDCVPAFPVHFFVFLPPSADQQWFCGLLDRFLPPFQENWFLHPSAQLYAVPPEASISWILQEKVFGQNQLQVRNNLNEIRFSGDNGTQSSRDKSLVFVWSCCIVSCTIDRAKTMAISLLYCHVTLQACDHSSNQERPSKQL